jgi:hypothetical protein
MFYIEKEANGGAVRKCLKISKKYFSAQGMIMGGKK